ncbi:MAG: DegT/DnrJ/EryC1/StrS family aminotransferase [Verrucomicrobiae bacterium]|nr:DegT/DnrJ/EryC1/StrS family aminotransferase [Verrucomicrobiae bacterium]
MPVPLLDLKGQNLALEGELRAAFDRVLRSGQFIMGPELEAFEADLAARLEVRHALGVSSGTDAILLALMALGIGPGDEVLVPSFTFFATAGCVARLGATPVFVDVCPVCFNLDVADAVRRRTARCKAVIPVHLFGQSADMDPILAWARREGLRVIEDAAQALGARYRGRPVGGLGDFGTFSFFPSKNLGGFGDAGLLVTQDDALADRARLLRVHGGRPKYHHQVVGANFRMDPLQAALLAVKLPHAGSYNAARSAHAGEYTRRLAALPGVRVAEPARCGCQEPVAGGGTGDGARLILPVAYPHNDSIWNQYTLRVPGPGRREALRDHLAGRGIGTEIYYPIPLHAQACFRPATGVPPELPVSERLAGEVLSVPVYPELTAEQRDEVVAGVATFLEGEPAISR